MIVCTGAPGSGKSTYVTKNMGSNDIVYDYDVLAMAISGATYDNRPVWMFRIQETLKGIIQSAVGPSEYWIIGAMPGAWEKEYYANKYRARILVFDPGIYECKRRIQKDKLRVNKTKWLYLIDEWYSKYTAFDGEEKIDG